VSNDKSLTWDHLHGLCKDVVSKITHQNDNVTNIIAVSRGGLIPATIISHLLNVDKVYSLGIKSYKGKSKNGEPILYQELSGATMWMMRSSTGCTLIVDDICDTGDTFKFIKSRVTGKLDNTRFVSLILKPKCPFVPRYYAEKSYKWIVYPWELNNSI